MKVAIIGTAGIPGKYGGFETLVHHLVQQLEGDYQFSVYCSMKTYNHEQRVSSWHQARMFYLPFNANGAQSIIYDIVSILHALFYADVLLVLGVSGSMILPFVRIFSKKKIVVNIDGLEWKRDKWNFLVKRFLRFCESIAVRSAHQVVTDNRAITDYVTEKYSVASSLIEYGADHVNDVGADKVNFTGYKKVRLFIEENRHHYFFKVCRIEPENNIHVILDAFSGLKEQLVIVGNWNNSEYSVKLKEKFSGADNIHLFDPIYNQCILDQFRRNAKCYLHGHSAGGTNPSLIEAMYLHLPVIAFDVVYNKETTEYNAIYFNSSENLQNIINTQTVDSYNIVADSMKRIAENRYKWSIISQQYATLFDKQ